MWREERALSYNVQKVLMTGGTGYIANQLLPTFRENYDMTLVDVKSENPGGGRVEGVRSPT